jgi:hypothetical protein
MTQASIAGKKANNPATGKKTPTDLPDFFAAARRIQTFAARAAVVPPKHGDSSQSVSFA